MSHNYVDSSHKWRRSLPSFPKVKLKRKKSLRPNDLWPTLTTYLHVYVQYGELNIHNVLDPRPRFSLDVTRVRRRISLLTRNIRTWCGSAWLLPSSESCTASCIHRDFYPVVNLALQLAYIGSPDVFRWSHWPAAAAVHSNRLGVIRCFWTKLICDICNEVFWRVKLVQNFVTSDAQDVVTSKLIFQYVLIRTRF